MRRAGWLAALVLAAALGPPLAAQEAAEPAAPAVTVAADDERPRIGQTVRLTLAAGGTPLAGARVTAVYRPNSSTTSTEELAPADDTGTVFWTPTAAGPVSLRAWPPRGGLEEAPAASLDVAVRYGGFPPSGLAIMLLAGALLVGGAAFGSIMLMRGPAVEAGVEPPST